ncbi:ABC transporter permease [Agrococcus jejuensis]|uniref:ABC-2 type transport system permease protein n=1 Tax=Agrococcus jejuensis TaxID=399736 RepID=A0A1G8E386_9MICO|nr:hypothetical protein [Agrococcus jejuensis]SDH64305.1 ABC-2 type transport system permease protein [Agrococcus jejuensis]
MLRGTGLLVAAHLRRDRLTLVLWTVLFAGLWASVGAGLGSSFDAQARSELVALIAADPSLRMLRGAPAGTSLGAVMVVSTLAYLGVAIALMATFLAVRHTRGDEDAGRAELVRSTPTGRLAPLVATAITGAIEVAIVSAGLLAGSLAIGLPAEGSALVALGVLLAGVAFVLVGLLAAQVMPSSRGANGLAAAIAGAAFVVRGVGDALADAGDDLAHVASAWPSWLSPIGWITQTHPFADPSDSAGWAPSWTPLALFAPLLLALGAVVVALESRRELGDSLVRERGGRATAHALLGTSLGLAVRLHRGAAIGWIAAAVVVGLFIGRVAPVAADAFEANPTLLALVQALGGTADDTIDTFVHALTGIVALVACAAVLQGATRMRTEELAHGEQVLATRTSRLGWFGATLAVALVAGVLVMTAFAAAASVSLASSDAARTGTVVAIAASMLPALGLYLAVGALLVAVLPGVGAWLGWLLLVVPMLVGELAPLFGDDWDWLQDVSPFHHLANPLATDPDWTASWWMLGGAAVALGVALAAFRRRDAAV